jgi:hypothetical protein
MVTSTSPSRALECVRGSRVCAPWPGRTGPQTEDRQADPAQLGRVAMEAPDHDPGDPGRCAFERDQIADACLVEAPVVVGDQNPAGGVGPETLEGLEEDVDRAGMPNGHCASPDRRPVHRPAE